MTDSLRQDEISRRRRAAIPRLLRYVRMELRHHVGEPGTEPQLEPATSGLRSLTFFVSWPSSTDSTSRLVVRCVRRRADARWLAAALNIFLRHSLPCPPQVHRDLSLWTRFRWGWSPFVERFIEGTPATQPLGAAQLEALGVAYARVHQVQRAWPGKPHGQTGKEPHLELLERVPRLADEVRARASPELAQSFAGLARSLLASPPARSATHSLCHGRVTPDNVLLTPSGKAVLIDLERVRYGSSLQELAALETEVLGGSASGLVEFLRGYRSAGPETLWPDREPHAWSWHRAFARFKAARDAVLAGKAPEAARLLDLAQSVLG